MKNERDIMDAMVSLKRAGGPNNRYVKKLGKQLRRVGKMVDEMIDFERDNISPEDYKLLINFQLEMRSAAIGLGE